MRRGLFARYKLSPWPSVLMVRYAFDEGAQRARASIAPFDALFFPADHPPELGHECQLSAARGATVVRAFRGIPGGACLRPGGKD